MKKSMIKLNLAGILWACGVGKISEEKFNDILEQAHENAYNEVVRTIKQMVEEKII